MTRRTLLKLVALLPWVGPEVAKALAQSELKVSRAFIPYLPAEFPKWNRGVDGLEDAGLWALQIERSRLPQCLTFPQVGQIWEATRDCEVSFYASIDFGFAQVNMSGFHRGMAPILSPAFFPFGTAELRRGEWVRIIEVDGLPPLRATFQPLRYQELQNDIVPEEMRKASGYGGYSLSMKTVKTISDLALAKERSQTWFIEAFALVQDVA